MAIEKCSNCDKVIGHLETPWLWQERIVCENCHRQLSAPPRTPSPAVASARGFCGICGGAIAADDMPYHVRGVAACPACYWKSAAQQQQQPQQPTQQIVVMQAQPSPGVAAIINIFLPGAGHLYLGRVFEGICWFIFVVIGYAMFVVPGLFLHFFCVLSAATHKHKPTVFFRQG